MSESRQVRRARERREMKNFIMQAKMAKFNRSPAPSVSGRPNRRDKPYIWGWRRLEIYRMDGDKLMQLHSTRGWKVA